MSEVNNTEVKSKFNITRRVLAFFNVGDDGKVDSFFIGLEKELKSEISRRQHNIGSLNFEHDALISRLNDNLEDAKLTLDNAWLNVNPEVIGSTRESQKSYRAQYLAGIEKATQEVEDLQDSIEKANKQHTEKLETLEKEIKELSYRIEKINTL